MKSKKIKKIANLVTKELLGIISSDESEELHQWVSKSKKNRLLYEDLTSGSSLKERHQIEQKVDLEAVKKSIRGKVMIESTLSHSRRNTILTWGLAIAAVVSLGLFITLKHAPKELEMGTEREQIAQLQEECNSEDVELTLDDGRKLIVDDGQQLRADEGDLEFVDNIDQTLIYKKEKVEVKPVYNTLSVPRGKDYNIVLSDGTKIHLNAGSQIRYPVAFVGEEREVWLVGEAYFEVEKDSKPFKVHSGDITVSVLGTSFNLMAYADEPIFETTLIEGLVQIELEGYKEGDEEKGVIVTPGSQAKFDTESGRVDVVEVETEKYIAWMQNVFLFDYETIEEIARKLERWYDVDIVIESNELAQTKFFGKLPKYDNITELFKVIEKIHPFRYEIDDDIITLTEKKP